MKEEIIAYLEKEGKSRVDQLADALKMTKSADFRELIKSISQLESQKRIRFDDSGAIFLPKDEEKQLVTVTGVFRANKAGFGFVSVEGEELDLFVGRNDVGHAIDGDLVEVAITKVANRLKGTAAEARVVKILEHGLTSVVGQLVLSDDKPKYLGYIKSKNQKIPQKIYIRKEPIALAGTEIVKVKIEKYPTKKHDYFVGVVEAIIGHKDDVGIDVLEVLESMDIVSDFPDAVMQEANQVPDAPLEKDYMGRVDLRDTLTFTIDGADAKDLDDAVHIKLLDNGNMELGVHIADVSYYVKEGSALDKEALARGTSVYVTDRVVPMLPERLSNGICSLNPNVARLTQSAIMEIDAKGRVVNYQITQTVIKTAFRMTYQDVNKILAGDEALMETYAKIVPSLKQMATLHSILEGMRERRGALNFDTKEAKILVDQKGLPVEIVLRERGVAERMIESFMLAANECVAEHFARRDLPFIYRIHEEPKAEKLQKFIEYASTFGIQVRGTAQEMTQEALQGFMKQVEGQTGSDVLSMMLLRSMQQARYSEHNHGHYGLAATYYTHFTSPIRRYPDLLVHRLIREYDQLTPEKEAHFASRIPEMATESSRLERRAIDAERVVEAMKKAEYMAQFVGQEFEGVISSVVKFGLFVALPNTIEGLIHVTALPEYFHYNERTMTLEGEKSGLVFRSGQAIKIRLDRADKETGDIDFTYLPSDLDVTEKRRKKRTRAPRKEKKDSAKKSDKPFYKAAVKKGGKHGKGSRKRRRTK